MGSTAAHAPAGGEQQRDITNEVVEQKKKLSFTAIVVSVTSYIHYE